MLKVPQSLAPGASMSAPPHRRRPPSLLAGEITSNFHFCPGNPPVEAPPLDVRPLVLSGPSDNRVDLVFFSDGYLASEQTKFLEDARRLAEDVTRNQTFYAVKPLLNFWAAFSPSNESGIGVGGVPKDTPFGLYRDGTELRAVYYSKPKVARAACDSLGSGCDYPVLLGNDPLYGGLGGRFTVITSSYLNGPLVLRHELGHSIINVGEEYDGAYGYSGVNSGYNSSTKSDLPWKQWLTDPSQKGEQYRVERSVMLFQGYPWTMLNTTMAWKVQFTSSGSYSRYLVKFSLSGIPEKSNLKVELDGNDLGWEPEPIVGLDRWHYDIHRSENLSAGVHELTFTLNEPSLEGVAQLCSAEVLEFGDESEFVSKPGHYSLYPTFSMNNETSYRPTNQDCLMRTVTKPNFCKACMEGLWINLLKRIHLIEGITESCAEVQHPESGKNFYEKILELQLVPLAHLRVDGSNLAQEETETYTVLWSKDGEDLPEYTNKTSLRINSAHSVGNYSVHVQFSTDAVRKAHRALGGTLDHRILSPCS
ncbi:hypothetical protein H1R20_g3718, partial [Candolleomyces eurysporus]